MSVILIDAVLTFFLLYILISPGKASTSPDPSVKQETTDSSPAPGHSLRTLLTTGLRPDESNEATDASEKKPETSQPVATKPSSHSPHITRTVTGSLMTRSSSKAASSAQENSKENSTKS